MIDEEDKKKKETVDNRSEFFWNYLTKTMRLKLEKWTKMITTNEFSVSFTSHFI
ncbi:hypothetical protein M5D96_014106 [Drosophila gunungcola]|uniref:Uncharacterized protein n=1 Tax=Drosophila gunungcola TaxID=103775 RepID=A0A9P9YA20_9MUSC|nr:hypothetical protein M5D96_014106 [Drosophila gunungcola]